LEAITHIADGNLNGASTLSGKCSVQVNLKALVDQSIEDYELFVESVTSISGIEVKRISVEAL
jgi:hypothetical protein